MVVVVVPAEATVVVAAEATAETEEAAKTEEAAPMGQVPQGALDMLQFRTVWQTNCALVTTLTQIKLGIVLLPLPALGSAKSSASHEILTSLEEIKRMTLLTTRCFPA